MLLDEKRSHVMQYDILNAVSFPAGLWLQVKVGEFGFDGLYDQGLVITLGPKWVSHAMTCG